MGNDTLRSELQHLERRVKLLINEYTRLKEDFENVRVENQHLRGQLQQQEAKLSNFQNQTKISKIVESMVVGDTDSDELKDVIDDYIKEIDKCIAHLGEAKVTE
ncbi:DUF3450 domain-containing protein [Marinoscillum furvescens]|uniref:Uncharacterized protein n=1 Tax=Marinoscillum furvescens DSM 4134 TaxID=1122208 RepID=A0A3D9KYL4_MARFU|nr:hypothetical protein [Marinoscillum furvescens]RED92819.1 hypothetical protein C7460_12836 [Marinoscillum furvescens DSM 4134]